MKARTITSVGTEDASDISALARRDRRIAELAEALERALKERDVLAASEKARFAELAHLTTEAEQLRAALIKAEARQKGLEAELTALKNAAARA